MRTFVLPISADYIQHWGLQEAVRELLQNAIDSDSPFEFHTVGSTLIIDSPEAELSVSDLVLGKSSKQDDSSKIGKFGEGFKLALAVLARENREIVVLNGNKSWIPEYRWDDTFQSEILHIDEYEFSNQDPGLQFVLRNLSDEEMAGVKEGCLHIWDKYPDHLKSAQGNILLGNEGMLYVNGLFVCETELKYGYDIKPEFLQLERDRQTVDGFDLKGVTGHMWVQQADYRKQIADDIANQVPDMDYISSSKDISDECALKFHSEYGSATVVSSEAEASAIRKFGGVAAVMPYGYCQSIKQSSYYAPAIHSANMLTKKQELEAYFARNKKHMRRLAIVEMKDLLNSWE